ncbi:MAG: hypothetical protein VKI42_00570 [Synechococcaceae cyanobacterium]|nr:hypothetical protein [Synechococcaceae cyanobacterium]
MGTIAMDPQRSSNLFRQALRNAGISVWDRVALRGAWRQGDRLCVLNTANRGSVGADLFIDASLGAVLIHAAGVAFQPRRGVGTAKRWHPAGAAVATAARRAESLQPQRLRPRGHKLPERDTQA